MRNILPTKAPTEQRNQAFGYSLVLLGALGFSAKAILIKLAYAANVEVDAITLMALRMLFALPFFLLVAIWRNKQTPAPPLDKKQWAAVIVLGLMGYYIASYLDFIGLQYISAGLERVIIFLYPTFVVLFSTVLPAFFMNAGIRRIGAGSASIISTTGPIATLVLAYLLLGEAITSIQLAGTFFVLAGVYVVSRVKT